MSVPLACPPEAVWVMWSPHHPRRNLGVTLGIGGAKTGTSAQLRQEPVSAALQTIACEREAAWPCPLPLSRAGWLSVSPLGPLR
jgi:hypothetical protein